MNSILDKKDFRILFALDKNSRATISQIAKDAKIPQETVRYRLNQFKKNKIIKHWITIINSTKIGYSYYDIYLKLHSVNEKKKSEIHSFLAENKNISWIGDLDGVYDLAFITIVKNQLELKEIIDEISTRFGHMIMKKTIAINLEGEFLRRDYLTNNERMNSKTSKYVLNTNIMVEIDELDLKICNLLSKNSRMTALEISQILGKSTDTTIQRIKNLKKKEIITGFGIILNNAQINQIHYKVFLYLNNSSNEKVKKLLSNIRMNNEVIAIIKTLAEWDYEIDLEVKDVNELKKFTMSITNQFSDVIKDYLTIRIVDMPKYVFIPEN